MAEASASERAYRRLKCDILAGSIPAGPIDTRALGDRLRMSVTPIREALARLNAERIVRQAPHQGFVVAMPSARRLEHLYELLNALMRLCLGGCSALLSGKADETSRLVLTGNYATDLTVLINDVAAAQPNSALMEAVEALNDQLFVARRCEPRLFAGADRELATLVSLWRSRNLRELRLGLRDHHLARVFRIDALARLVSEESGTV